MNTSETKAHQDYSLTKADLDYFKNFWPNIAKAWNNGDRAPYIKGHENAD